MISLLLDSPIGGMLVTSALKMEDLGIAKLSSSLLTIIVG